ncbi:conserved hypothetical protein [uncultured Paludibacter sp.]|uniref:Glycoside hydrolase family 5 domain-containing protein n=1 Tax=uncultured Paludibacter sp. TaxID=497635 RepID=A0A653A6M9_9BACT|nr:conserved hypothetical protein [uncultured Paludibacter sp.]
MIMSKLYFWIIVILSILFLSCSNHPKNQFISVRGKEMITPDGKPFVMKGTNLGNWLNPEEYMFQLNDVSSYRLIDEAFKEMVGEDFVNQFWRKFQDNYITQADIHYIRQTGMNSIRLPFHYKLFTNRDYMGQNDSTRGFELIDKVVKWCKEEGLYVVLDMHDAPGGQTGDNIDDSYGYPWIFENENDQNLYVSIWKRIAEHYASEPIIIGYDLMNEPIATFFEKEKDELNKKLQPLYEKATKAIREVDKNHIIIIGGAQWNQNFDIFNNLPFDDNMMLTCHTYGCDTTKESIQRFLDYSTKVNLPIYMGETGENTDTWVKAFRKVMDENNMGWHFWPYKKIKVTSCLVSITEPKNWEVLGDYTKKDRSNFWKIREVRPNQKIVKEALNDLLEKIKFENCTKNNGYIEALGMKP